jgi:hypothetical protein
LHNIVARKLELRHRRHGPIGDEVMIDKVGLDKVGTATKVLVCATDRNGLGANKRGVRHGAHGRWKEPVWWQCCLSWINVGTFVHFEWLARSGA